MSYFDEYRASLVSAFATIDLDALAELRRLLEEARANGRTIFTCGNGGSASTASHFATDLLKGASYERSAKFRVVALTDATSTISAYSNDVGYEAAPGCSSASSSSGGRIARTFFGSVRYSTVSSVPE